MEKKAVINETHTKDGKEVKIPILYVFDDQKHATVQESIAAKKKFIEEDKIKQIEFEKQHQILNAGINILVKEYQDWRNNADQGYLSVEVYVNPNDIEFVEG